MQIVLLTHPKFLPSRSMPKFANMIVDGLEERGHSVEIWTARPIFWHLPAPLFLKKWLGYIDQFIVFPLIFRVRVLRSAPEAVFVFADQALGPWVPLARKYANVIHCHDFLALRSAMGEFSQNRTAWTGRIYQSYIRRGFEKGCNFISVSDSTRQDLHRLSSLQPGFSITVYNGLNYPFKPMSRERAVQILSARGIDPPEDGFILHVGGNQWYKNRRGVIAIHHALLKRRGSRVPLWLIGAEPTEALMRDCEQRGMNDSVRFLVGLNDEAVCAAYSLASVLIFPSIAEGFGWPIVEAMASGCPVVTTDSAPMTEIGGSAVTYIPQMPLSGSSDAWAEACAAILEGVLLRSRESTSKVRDAGIERAERFSAETAIDAYEAAYQRALAEVKR